MKQSQRGASLIVVLVLLSVLLLGVVSLARMSDASTLMAGNIASKGKAMAASEVGLAEAAAALSALTTPDVADATWYSPTKLVDDTVGLPTGINWSTIKSSTVGGYTVRYFVERMCSVSPVTALNTQCSVKKAYVEGSSKAGGEALESTPAIEYRATVSVAGPKDTATFVQVLFSQ
jgi:Tfp pilus assembly protein PilX